MRYVYDRNFLINGLILLVLASLWFGIGLKPSSDAAESKVLIVEEGEGVSEISQKLEEENLIRSSFAFKVAAFLKGQYAALKPGNYILFPSSSTLDILGKLVRGDRREIETLIPQGATIYEIDVILSTRNIIQPGELVEEVLKNGGEGELFPDTYRFFVGSDAKDVVAKMRDNFKDKTKDVFRDYQGDRHEAIVMASLIEREVPSHDDARVVAGIFWKRLKEGMALQIDASICRPKLERLWREGRARLGCGPITSSDLREDSPYNTYLNKGLPPTPIGSPGLISLESAVHPSPSPYWFYLSDPATGDTIFARNYDEHLANINRYLR